jgi:hypothetical protein
MFGLVMLLQLGLGIGILYSSYLQRNYKKMTSLDILKNLGYYNFNLNMLKTSIIVECIQYLLYSSNPNYNYDFCFDDYDIKEPLLDELEHNFETLCQTQNKNKFEFTNEELIKFIKTQEIYKQIDQKLNYAFSRTIILSKYINDKTTDNLLKNLTKDELTTLNISVSTVFLYN